MRAVLVLAMLCGCEVAKATAVPLPKERVAECSQICADVGMKLGAFVVIHSSAGCVCEPIAGAAPSANAGGAGATSGAALIAIEQEEAAQAAGQTAMVQAPPAIH